MLNILAQRRLSLYVWKTIIIENPKSKKTTLKLFGKNIQNKALCLFGFSHDALRFI